MNYLSENKSQTSFSLEELVQKNSQSMEAMEREPYQPVVYAIPEKQWEEWLKLLTQAVQFQPTLYSMIAALTTRDQMAKFTQDTAKQEKQFLDILLTQTEAIQTKLEKSISQVGKDREKSTSEISELVEKNRTEIQKLVSDMHRKLRKLLLWTAALSILLSVLVCMAWQHWLV